MYIWTQEVTDPPQLVNHWDIVLFWNEILDIDLEIS